MMNRANRDHLDVGPGQLRDAVRIGLGLLVVIAFSWQSAFAQNLKSTNLECRSENFGRAVCSVGAPIEQIRLTEKKSNAPCVEGSTFGFSGRSVWVDKGCAAQFEVSYRTDSSGSQYSSAPEVQSLRCTSQKYARAVCTVEGRVRSVSLVRQRSQSRCEQGTSFGYQNNSIWVDKGCDADFEVQFTPRSNYRRASRNRTTTFICKSTNRQLGACYVPGAIADIRLLNKRSRASCVNNSSFGFQRDVLWVKDGCEGNFEVTYRPDDTSSAWEFTNSGAQSKSLICKSDRFQEGRCNAGGMISAISLKTTRSRAACTPNSTFGYNFDEVWVTKGCEGEFEVLYFPRP